ncbi:MAG: endo alpha-1,4 polygalactosaminidase [Dehalococcoidales bacterium]|nr:endo alpha-1,4 polygalactosaminidase [Dehalococcoidales bacterium]
MVAIVAGQNTLNVAMQQTAPPSGWWKPTPAAPIHWQWQIGTDFSYPSHVLPNVTVYDIDGFSTSAATVASLHALGCKVIAYFSFGTYENWRPDASKFTAADKGKSNGWPGEIWIDIRSANVRNIMAARMDIAVSKGFDALEPDNIDGYSNNTGFPLTAADQINFNTWIAQQCHARGLSVGLKNDVDQISQLVSQFDWVLNEECNQYSECGNLSLFVQAGKAVFQCEYSGSGYCSAMNSAHFNSMKRDMDLTAGASKRVPCIPDTQNTW